MLENTTPPRAHVAPLQGNLAFFKVRSFLLASMVLCLLVDRFGLTLRQTLDAALKREEELEQLRGTLEATVTDRTATLQAALGVVTQREAELSRALDELRSSQDTIRELSVPVIPVLPGVLVAPLVGALDSARTALLMEQLLAKTERAQARFVIFDVTGVPVIDTQVAQVLIKTAVALGLLSAQVLVVGMWPEVASPGNPTGVGGLANAAARVRAKAQGRAAASDQGGLAAAAASGAVGRVVGVGGTAPSTPL